MVAPALLLANDVDELRRAVARFNAPGSPRELVRSLVRTTSYWVFDSLNGTFGPGKFVGYSNSHFQAYAAARDAGSSADRFDGAVTRKQIEKVAGKPFATDLSLAQRLEGWADALLGEAAFDGIDREKWAFVSLPVPATNQERARRDAMWAALRALGDPSDVTTAQISEAGIRPERTGHGIFRDHANTAAVAPPHGITLTLLDIGESYRDEFDEVGGIYHYPTTQRGDRDVGEIEATKNALRLGLPVFAILRGHTPGRRCVRRGRVTDSDDETRQFLVSFEEPAAPNAPKLPSTALDNSLEQGDDAPLDLIVKRPTKLASVKARPGQARFRFAALKRYGARCALCRVVAEPLLEAVHIVPYEFGGADDARNALVLCRNHHRAFDAHLISFDPETLEVVVADGLDAAAMLVEHGNLQHLAIKPAKEALRWRADRPTR